MKKLILAFILFFAFPFWIDAQVGVKNGFKGYTKLENNSFLKYLVKGQGTTAAETGGALFLKLSFLADVDTVFVDVNKETNTASYPMRLDSCEYKGDFLDIMLKLKVGDSVKVFMSLDSLNKYFPGEFIFGQPWDNMKYLGMAIKVDSMYSREKTLQLQAQVAAEKYALYKAQRTADSLALLKYLSANNFSSSPNGDGMWFRTLKDGTGNKPLDGNSVKVKIVHAYSDASFSADSVATFIVGDESLPSGWNISIRKMKVGEEAIWIVPCALMPANSRTKIYQVTLLEIKK